MLLDLQERKKLLKKDGTTRYHVKLSFNSSRRQKTSRTSSRFSPKSVISNKNAIYSKHLHMLDLIRKKVRIIN